MSKCEQLVNQKYELLKQLKRKSGNPCSREEFEKAIGDCVQKATTTLKSILEIKDIIIHFQKEISPSIRKLHSLISKSTPGEEKLDRLNAELETLETQVVQDTEQFKKTRPVFQRSTLSFILANFRKTENDITSLMLTRVSKPQLLYLSQARLPPMEEFHIYCRKENKHTLEYVMTNIHFTQIESLCLELNTFYFTHFLPIFQPWAKCVTELLNIEYALFDSGTDLGKLISTCKNMKKIELKGCVISGYDGVKCDQGEEESSISEIHFIDCHFWTKPVSKFVATWEVDTLPTSLHKIRFTKKESKETFTSQVGSVTFECNVEE